MGHIGPRGLTGYTGPTGPLGATGVIGPIGNYLRVDIVYGNDALAVLQPYTLSFKTITAALASALPGQTVYVYPGVYNEIITIPTGVALRGTNVLTTIIQSINPTSATTVVTLNQNTRLEDITVNMSIASPLDAGPYIGVDFLTGSSINAKIRTCSITMSLLSGSTTIFGVRSAGASSLTTTASHAIRSTQVSVIATGTLPARGIFVNGANQLLIREGIVYCTGAGTNLVACETLNTSAILTCKSTTICGTTYDLLQSQGQIIIGASDLVNHTAPLSFLVSIQPARTFVGMLGFPGGNLTYYLPPTITPIASVSTTTPYPFSFIQPVVIIAFSVTFSGTITGTDTLSCTIYKNGFATGLSITLNNLSPQTLDLITVGVTFLPTDIIDIRLVTVGSPNAGTFTGKFLSY
jgi:hypothetical protein